MGGEEELMLLPCTTAVMTVSGLSPSPAPTAVMSVSSLSPASLSPNESSGRESARQHFPEGAAPALPRKWS